MIVETVSCLVLHCSRCDQPLKDDYEVEGAIHWPDRDAISKMFARDVDPFGWRQFGDRIVCAGCQTLNDDGEPCERPEPLPPLDADKVARAQAGYRKESAHA